jgi:hypothetical protein
VTNIFESFLITAHLNNYFRFVWIVEFCSGRRLTSLDEEYLVALDLLCCEPVSPYASEDIVAAAIFSHLIRVCVCIRATVVPIEWFTIR